MRQVREIKPEALARAEEAWDGRMGAEEGARTRRKEGRRRVLTLVACTLCHGCDEDVHGYSPLVPRAWFTWLLSTSVSRGYLSSSSL